MAAIDLSDHLSRLDLGADVQLLAATASHQGAGAQVKVVVDTIDGITVDEITGITKLLRKDADLAELAGTPDFRIEVTSPGVAAGLQEPWQFQRHIGRRLEIRMHSDDENGTGAPTVKGDLLNAGHDGISLENDGEHMEIAWDQIDTARVLLSW
ncbi:MAG: hypothetical protein V3W14_13085 [Candidatus Neomarinimicrobiota bacterium]